MNGKHWKAGVAALALSLGLANPAFAGKHDRAKEAIAAAEAKLQANDTAGAGAEMPAGQAEARRLLNMAKENLSAGRKSQAIADANQASALAETVLGEVQKRKETQASLQTQQAQTEASIAQQQAAEANARAANAEQSAAVSAAQAQAAQAQAAAAASTPPAQVETTVTTQNKATPTTKKAVRTKVVRKSTKRTPVASSGSAVTTTTTTVKQAVN